MMKMTLGVVLSLGLVSAAWAEKLHYNVVQLSDSAQIKVSQNQLHVTLVVEEVASQRQQASERNTAKLNRVLNEIATQELKGQLLNRSVNERVDYVNGQRMVQGWADTAQISVYSEDTAKINRLVASVQADARLESQQYGLTDVLRREYERQLTTQAIKNFQNQAQHITESLGAKRYRLVELVVGEVSQSYHAPRVMMAKSMMAADAAEVAQDLPGETEIQVQVSGKIQVQ